MGAELLARPGLAVVLLAALGAAASGLPGLLLGRRSPAGERLAAWLMGAAAVAGLVASLAGGGAEVTAATAGGRQLFRLDGIARIFLAAIFVLAGAGSVYGLGYWIQAEQPRCGRRVRAFWGILVAALVVLVLAADMVLFLTAWEVMAIAAFFLVSTEDHLPEARRAGLLYLVATHAGTLALVAMFALWRGAAGSFALSPLDAAAVGLPLANSLFFLALFGFGLKAGLMPLHWWLPEAHAAAPSHVSALMSGVLIKMGIYGLVRIGGLLPEPPLVWGGTLLVLGASSCVLGVVFALAQHDLKRLLAYHSIENIGIITIGLGLAFAGRSLGKPEWVLLGLAGCLLHVWNHGLFKGLLFLAAGSVVHALGTRRLEQMGGVGRAMPITAALFLVGALAICGLPPFNGFVSELLVYLGLLQTLHGGSAPAEGAATWPADLPHVALAAPALAMAGALALACFVKVYGMVFLGTPRDARFAGRAHEAPLVMLVPMALLGGLCALIGLAPLLVVPWLDQAVADWAPGLVEPATAGAGLGELVPFGWVSVAGAVLLAACLGGAWVGERRRRRAPAAAAATWDCGFIAGSPRIQYTASSFAERIIGLFRAVLRPRTHAPQLSGAFPQPSRFESHVDDSVLEHAVLPGARRLGAQLGRLRILQQGRTQSYVAYIGLTVVVLMLWGLPVRELLERVFSR